MREDLDNGHTIKLVCVHLLEKITLRMVSMQILNRFVGVVSELVELPTYRQLFISNNVTYHSANTSVRSY